MWSGQLTKFCNYSSEFVNCVLSSNTRTLLSRPRKVFTTRDSFLWKEGKFYFFFLSTQDLQYRHSPSPFIIWFSLAAVLNIPHPKWPKSAKSFAETFAACLGSTSDNVFSVIALRPLLEMKCPGVRTLKSLGSSSTDEMSRNEDTEIVRARWHYAEGFRIQTCLNVWC